MSYFFRLIRIMGIVTEWSAKALADGKITLEEAVELAVRIAEVLGIPTEIEVPE